MCHGGVNNRAGADRSYGLQRRHVGHGREEHLGDLLDDARIALLGKFVQARGHKVVDGLDVHGAVALSHRLHLMELEGLVVVNVPIEEGEIGGGSRRGGGHGFTGDGCVVPIA